MASADVLGPEALQPRLIDGRPRGCPPVAEAAAAVWLGRADDPGPGPRRIIEAALGPALDQAAAGEHLMREVLARAELPVEALAEVITADAGEAQRELLAAATTGLSEKLPLLHLALRVGDAGAPLGLLALLAALEEAEPRLILATDRGGSLAVVVH